MAEIRKIDMNGKEILINLSVSRREYEVINHNTDKLVVIPTGPGNMQQTLTTGTLGNSNRIMLPKKLLERESIGPLEKKVPAKITTLNGDIYLLIKLKKSEMGIPKFEDD